MLRFTTASFLVMLAGCGDGRTDLGEVVYVDGDGGRPSDARDEGDVHSIIQPKDATPDAPPPTCGFDGDPSPPGTHPYGNCSEGVNTDYPPIMTCSGSSEAFEWVPQTAFSVARIEIHTNKNATVALLDSDCDKPGKLLFTGVVDGPPSGIQWRGATLPNPIPVIANHRYFVYFPPIGGGLMCPAAAGGVMVREYTADTASGPWNGPFSGIFWSARLIGTCGG